MLENVVATALGGLSRDLLAEIEQIDFQLVVEEDAIVLQTSLRYDLHVRPATFLYTRLRERGVAGQLSLRRAFSGVWVTFEPLSMLALALRRGEEIQVRVSEPANKELLLTVMEAFRCCPLYRDYSEEETPAAAITRETFGEAWQFQREFEAEDDRSCLIKLHIENFIIGHVAEIESYLLTEHNGVPPSWEQLDDSFKRLFGGGFEQFGIMSLDVPYDNLMQIRDMCYHLHFRQLEQQQKIPYTLMNIEWSAKFGPEWRLRQAERLRYFYERESTYYRDLFLALVTREVERLRLLISRWSARLDYSLHVRRELQSETRKFEAEMRNFSPNFDNPEEFCRHIRLMGDMVIKNISRLSAYVQQLRDQRIYTGDSEGRSAWSHTTADSRQPTVNT